MNTGSLGKMKMSTVTDWIDDHFDQLEERVPESTRFLLEGLLETVHMESEQETVHFLHRIFDPDLTPQGVSDLFRELNDRRVPVRDQYAPRQRDLNEWIRSFCLD